MVMMDPRKRYSHDGLSPRKQQEQHHDLALLYHQRDQQRQKRIIRCLSRKKSNNSLLFDNIIVLVFVLVQFLLTHHSIMYVNGFASWLKCDVDILDEDEVIMNMYLVQPKNYNPNDVMHELVQIEIQQHEPSQQTEFILPPIQRNNQNDAYSTWEYPSDVISTWNIQLHLPLPSENNQVRHAFYELQYVIDIISVEYDHDSNNHRDANDNENNVRLTSGTHFIAPSNIVCEGQRIYITQMSEQSTRIQINGTNTKSITLQGAWARGREEVKVTRPFIFQRSSSSATGSTDSSSGSSTEDDPKDVNNEL